jgi:hypothetical protein
VSQKSRKAEGNLGKEEQKCKEEEQKHEEEEEEQKVLIKVLQEGQKHVTMFA